MNKTLGLKLDKNKKTLQEIATKNAIKYMGLFGSYARGEEIKSSDIDILVKFDFSNKNIGLFALYRIQKQLENLFGNNVDIVTKPNKFIKPFIEKDLVTIYERR